jgi:hypothetical protein
MPKTINTNKTKPQEKAKTSKPSQQGKPADQRPQKSAKKPQSDKQPPKNNEVTVHNPKTRKASLPPGTKLGENKKRHPPGLKMPSIKSFDEDQMQQRLKAKSPWFASIRKPKQGAAVKIPDSTGIDTGTLQMVLPVAHQANAQGIVGVKVACPYPNNFFDTIVYGYNYMVTQPDATASSVKWGNGTLTTGDQKALTFPSNEFFLENALGVRIVSACITGMHEISSNNDTGEMTAWQIPFETSAPTGASYSSYATWYGSSSIALNMKKALVSRWYPTSMMK